MTSPGATEIGPSRLSIIAKPSRISIEGETAQQRLRLIDRPRDVVGDIGSRRSRRQRRLCRRDRRVGRYNLRRRLFLELVDARGDIGEVGRRVVVDPLAEFVEARALVVLDAVDARGELCERGADACVAAAPALISPRSLCRSAASSCPRDASSASRRPFRMSTFEARFSLSCALAANSRGLANVVVSGRRRRCRTSSAMPAAMASIEATFRTRMRAPPAAERPDCRRYKIKPICACDLAARSFGAFARGAARCLAHRRVGQRLVVRRATARRLVDGFGCRSIPGPRPRRRAQEALRSSIRSSFPCVVSTG